MNEFSSRSQGQPQRLRALRLQHGLSQTALARSCGIDVRTIQRAERGETLRLETFAIIAASLKVRIDEILVENPDGILDDFSDSNAVALRKISSGKILLDIICDSFSGEVNCGAEPTKDNIEVLSNLVQSIEEMMPNPWAPQTKAFSSLAERLRAAVQFGTKLEELERVGICVYGGTYTASAQIPRYDFDEGHYYTQSNQEYKAVTMCRITFDRADLERVVIKVSDRWSDPGAPVRPQLEDRSA